MHEVERMRQELDSLRWGPWSLACRAIGKRHTTILPVKASVYIQPGSPGRSCMSNCGSAAVVVVVGALADVGSRPLGGDGFGTSSSSNRERRRSDG